jgi:RNA polymerase sigma-70 factor (ECF subfamily)
MDPDGEPASWIMPLLRESRTPEGDWAAAELRRRLLSAIEALPEPLREAFVSSELGGESFDEMARRTGTPVGTLLSRKHRAVLRLRKTLADVL